MTTTLRRRKALPPAPFPVIGSWIELPPESPALRVVRRAVAYCGIHELRPNRGEHIDRWNRWANVPESLIEAGKGYWCASFAGGVLREEGLCPPQDYGSCDAWLPYIAKGAKPRPGDLICYGKPKDLVHIGLVVCDQPLLTVEGNRSWGWGPVNNGWAVDIGPPARHDVVGVCPLESFLP